MRNALVVGCAIVLQTVASHSWVECTSYDPISFDYDKLGDFDRARCSGYPRAFGNQFRAGFSVDTGYNWELPTCRDKYKASDYNDQVVMATYTSGQVIYISHPAKNHVADTCTNPFIPSGITSVMVSSGLETDTFDINLQMIGDDHVNGVIDHLEFQRCYDFCGDMDGAHCLTGWQLPNNLASGVHSFIWKWEFNDGQYYANCFDAYITNGEPLPPTMAPNGSGDADPSSSGSGSGDITLPPPSVVPTPFPSSMPTPTPSPTPVMTDTPDADVVSSGVPPLMNPLASLKSYLINITGFLNITFT